MRAGLIDYVGLPEVDGAAAHERGEPATAECLRGVGLGDATEDGGGVDAVGVEVGCVGE